MQDVRRLFAPVYFVQLGQNFKDSNYKQRDTNNQGGYNHFFYSEEADSTEFLKA